MNVNVRVLKSEVDESKRELFEEIHKYRSVVYGWRNLPLCGGGDLDLANFPLLAHNGEVINIDDNYLESSSSTFDNQAKSGLQEQLQA